MSSNGKGSTRRGGLEADRKYREGWDSIFGPEPKAVHKTTKCGRRKPVTMVCRKPKLLPYPVWVCSDCATKAGGKAWTTSTFHTGDCEVCGITQWVTEPRDFAYPTFPGHEPRKTMTQAEFWGSVAGLFDGPYRKPRQG